LKNLIFHDDEVEITRLLFYEHPNYLDPDIIEPEQVFVGNNMIGCFTSLKAPGI
jgi:hypothetical protein